MIRHRGFVVFLLAGLASVVACASTPPDAAVPPSMVASPVAGEAVAQPAAPAQPIRVAASSPQPGIVSAGAVSPPPVAAAPVNVYSGPQPCTLALRGDSPVVRACREGGTRSAKAAMKALVTQARTNGATFRCDDCHSNTDANYAQLAQGAQEKFSRLLGAAGVK